MASQDQPQNLFAVLLDRVRAANEELVADGLLPAGIDQSRVVVEPPRDASHGDMATNAAMVLAKDAGKKPRELADAMAAKLRADPLVEKVDMAGPGFINLTLKASAWSDALRAAITAGPDFGRSALGDTTKINVEYVSANPTGPMHVGHCRGAVFGDALASLLAFTGYAVTREYYVNDAGAQINVLTHSAFLRYREALGEDIGKIPEGLYPGDYLKECGAELAADHGDKLKQMPEAEWFPIVRERATNMMVAEIRNDLAGLNVVHDVWFSERSLTEGEQDFTGIFSFGDALAGAPPPVPPPPIDKIAETIEALREQGYVYEGRLPPPKGAPVEDYEDREQTLFRATAFGDDVDRPLMKSDGNYTYFAADIAYHRSKFERGFDHMIDVWGADHGGYIKRMQAAVKAVSAGKADLDVKIVQLVRLLRAGEPVKMSKRSGEFVTLREVVDEVGRDAVRFMMLYRKNDATLDFDLAKVIEKSRDNPVFYVQYGHARGHSIFRMAKEVLPDLPEQDGARAARLAKAPLDRLNDPAELALMRRIALYPRMLDLASLAHEPHRVAFYLYELASEFHAQWARGTDLPYLRFIIQNDPELTLARLALVQGVVTVLASGLGLLGVEAPQEMRRSCIRSHTWVRTRMRPERVTCVVMEHESAPKAEEFTTAEMAEDPRYRSSDPFAKPQGGASGGDPLAELARLIGQNDPFAELNQRGTPPRPEQRAPNAAPSVDWRSSPLPDPFRSQPSAPPAYSDPFASQGATHAPRRPEPPFPSFVTQGAPQPHAPHVNGQPYAGAPAGYAAPPSDPYQQQAYDPAAYAEQPPGYETDPYYAEKQPQDGTYPSYEEVAAPRRRGGILTVLAVLALAIVGTAGAFGYRAVFGNSGSVGGAPPVIRADGSPTKIVPTATSGEAQSNKLIYDRVGDRNQGEKVQSREEQPVEIREPASPRTIFPGPAQASTAMPPNASGLAPVTPAPGAAEPKKVKTVTIRADGSLPPGAASAAVPLPARNAAPQVAMTEPAPRTVRTQPVQSQPVQSGNAPLSLQAPSGAAPAQAMPPAPRVASAPAPRVSDAPAAGGSYMQVSSQLTEAEAQSSLRSLQARYANVLGGRQSTIRRAEIPNIGTRYRAFIGPLASNSEAIQLCESLKAAGGQCVVPRN